MRNTIRVMITSAAALLFFTTIAAPASATPAGERPLQLVQTFRLPSNIKGHFDHIVVDAKRHRLFATPEDYRAVLVIDTDSGKLIHEIQGIEEPHAILYRPEKNLLYITDGKDGSVKVFDATTYKMEHRIPLLKDSDSIGYDPTSQYLYVDNGGGDVGASYSMLSIIDTNTFRKIDDIRIDGDTLEAMALDPNRPQIYVNDRAKNEIAVVNPWTRKLVAMWPVTMGKTNVTMGYDVDHHRLFVGCRSGELVVFDTDSGKELQALPIVKGADDTAYDPNTKRIYTAGDGAMSVYQEMDPDHYKLLGNVPTGPLGKTARLVPDLGLMYIAVPQHGTTDPSIMVFKPVGTKSIADDQPPAQIWPVSAPAAERLVMNTLSRYTDLNKLGLHAVPPGGTMSLVIANGNMGKVGKATSAKDISDISGGKIFCDPNHDGAFYDMKLPMFDASGRRIGMLVMEIPFTAVQNSAQAVHLAETIRKQMSEKVSDLQALFQS